MKMHSALSSSLLALCLAACFSAAQGENGVLKFMMVGDWGGQSKKPYYTESEGRIADQMGKTAADIGANFTIAVGDNFYDDGVTDVDDKRFKDTFEDVFTAKSLQSRWYVVAGNHDYHGNVSAQIAYTARSDRWYMPDYYYTEVVSIEGTNTKVQFVFIDTVMLCGISHPTKKWIQPSGPASLNAAEEQWEWIEKTIATSTAKWLFVVGHYPVWSVGAHGPTEQLLDRLRPLLRQYNVSAYFCGHDHEIEHIHEPDSTVEYFLSGAGHETSSSDDNKHKVPDGSLKFRYGEKDHHQKHGAFNWVSLSPTQMNITVVDAKGNDIYFYSSKPTRS